VEAYATAAQVYAGGLVFARVGAMVMLMPGIGDAAIPPRIRLAFSLLLALVLTPVVAGAVGPPPATVGILAGRVIHELVVGLMIGAILRIFVSSLFTAGEVMSIQTTLGFAQTANPAQAQPSSALSSFLAMTGIVLIMTTDLHHLFIGAIAHSYQLFPFTRPAPTADAAALAVQTVASSFALGIQLAAPVIVFSLVFNIATGLIGRVMPQFQIFFVASPLAVLFGLSIFAVSLGGMGMIWVDHYRDLIGLFG
jgi:flagellar biosynthetic protein FliR